MQAPGMLLGGVGIPALRRRARGGIQPRRMNSEPGQMTEGPTVVMFEVH